jgi:hypothetical protein
VPLSLSLIHVSIYAYDSICVDHSFLGLIADGGMQDVFTHVLFILWGDLCFVSQALAGHELSCLDKQKPPPAPSSSQGPSIAGPSGNKRPSPDLPGDDIVESLMSGGTVKGKPHSNAAMSSGSGLFMNSKRSVNIPGTFNSNVGPFRQSSSSWTMDLWTRLQMGRPKSLLLN